MLKIFGELNVVVDLSNVEDGCCVASSISKMVIMKLFNKMESSSMAASVVITKCYGVNVRSFPQKSQFMPSGFQKALSD